MAILKEVHALFLFIHFLFLSGLSHQKELCVTAVANYDLGNKSLAHILHVNEGWKEEGMLEVTNTFAHAFSIMRSLVALKCLFVYLH